LIGRDNIDMDEQHLKPTNEIVKLILNSNRSLVSHSDPLQVEIQMPVHVQKIYLYEAETQTSFNELSDCLSKDAGDEARLTGSNKYGLLSLDEYQITRTGEDHCLKKYFSDDDLSFSNDDQHDLDVEQQMKHITLDDRGDRVGEFKMSSST
jgi:hypothetical protein